MANQNQQKLPDLVPINGSTNVYVGQRYVPKFYDDGTEQHGATWDKTKTYEPLTIVLWEGDSYTSRTFVPTGVEISNTQYWLPTGLFNAQLQSYINIVNNLTNNTNENLTVQNSYKASLKNKQMIILGDSWANGENNTSGWYPSFTEALNGYQVGRIIPLLQNGAGFCKNPWLNILSSAEIENPEDISNIYICGITNDRDYDYAALLAAMENFKQYVNINYVNATIEILMVGFPWTIANINKFMQAAETAGIKATPMMEYCCFIGGGMWTETQHPTNPLYAYVGNHISSYILDESTNYYQNETRLVVKPNSGITTSNTHQFVITGTNATKNVKILDTYFNGVGSGKTALGTLNLASVAAPFNFNNFKKSIPFMALVRSGTDYYPASCIYTFEGTLDSLTWNIEVNAPTSVTNINQVHAPELNMSLNSLLY